MDIKDLNETIKKINCFIEIYLLETSYLPVLVRS